MTLDELESQSDSLYNLVNECCWNKLSENRKYIITEILDGQTLRDDKYYDTRLQDQKRKTPMSAEDLLVNVIPIYKSIYDINLEVFMATEDLTIIDFRYYPISSLGDDHPNKNSDGPIYTHIKVPHPYYKRFLPHKKFDANWQNLTEEYWKYSAIVNKHIKEANIDK